MNEELQKLKEEFEQRIRELDDKYNPEEEWPKAGDDYWFIIAPGRVTYAVWKNSNTDKEMLEFGNIFKTKAEAKFEVERLKVLRELEKLGRPFVEDENNWSFYLEDVNVFQFECCSFSRSVYGDYYFDTEEEVVKAINKIGRNRIKQYLFRLA